MDTKFARLFLEGLSFQQRERERQRDRVSDGRRKFELKFEQLKNLIMIRNSSHG